MRSAEKSKVRRIKGQLNDIMDVLDEVKSLEKEYLGNVEDKDYPSQEKIDIFNETIDSLDSAYDNIESALSDLETID